MPWLLLFVVQNLRAKQHHINAGGRA